VNVRFEAIISVRPMPGFWPKAADRLRDTSDASRSKPGVHALSAAILDVADATAKGQCSARRKDTPSVFCLFFAPLNKIGF
jgi:hypothetical protein